MFDLVLDNKEVPPVSQKLFKVRFVMLIKVIGLFEDVFIQLGRVTRTSSSMFCLPCTLGFFSIGLIEGFSTKTQCWHSFLNLQRKKARLIDGNFSIL